MYKHNPNSEGLAPKKQLKTTRAERQSKPKLKTQNSTGHQPKTIGHFSPPQWNRDHGDKIWRNQQPQCKDILPTTSRFRSQKAINHQPSAINPSADAPIHN